MEPNHVKYWYVLSSFFFLHYVLLFLLVWTVLPKIHTREASFLCTTYIMQYIPWGFMSLKSCSMVNQRFLEYFLRTMLFNILFKVESLWDLFHVVSFIILFMNISVPFTFWVISNSRCCDVIASMLKTQKLGILASRTGDWQILEM